ncbi:MAG: carboxymuconolactone decarboxylase family protein [Candidatus Thermoplasmatota archaeon]|jgi:AhpD family alkylhydroperoxidase|nr:carboxymuconolactone decarboxylase family protein [Candidatus Thermoplasmatota archaeon]MCL5793342.1 carboxymuconolactone decarboxylase family protein [Candidatus Thermoplasmatota archaeon]
MDSKHVLDQVMETMGFSGSVKPDMQKGFMDFYQAVLKPGSLSVKTKELIAIALSLSSSCEWCITYHTKLAVDNGATDDEILEAAYVAVLMAGSPALMHVSILKSALEISRPK